MARQLRLELIVTTPTKIRDAFDPEFKLDSAYLLSSLIDAIYEVGKDKICRIRDRGVSQSCGVILREREPNGYFYSFHYSINARETQNMRLPESGHLPEEKLANILLGGLNKINDEIRQKQQPGLILACEEDDHETIQKTFENLGYNVHCYYTHIIPK